MNFEHCSCQMSIVHSNKIGSLLIEMFEILTVQSMSHICLLSSFLFRANFSDAFEKKMENAQKQEVSHQNAEKNAQNQSKKTKKPKLVTRADMLRYMSRFKFKKQRPILPRTFANTQSLSTTRLEPKPTPKITKPILSRNVKARIESDLDFLLQNQKMIPARVKAPESYFSLQTNRTKPAATKEQSANKKKTLNKGNAEKSNAVNSNHWEGVTSGNEATDDNQSASFLYSPRNFERSDRIPPSTISVSKQNTGNSFGHRADQTVEILDEQKAKKSNECHGTYMSKSRKQTDDFSFNLPKRTPEPKKRAPIAPKTANQSGGGSLFDFNTFESQINAGNRISTPSMSGVSLQNCRAIAQLPSSFNDWSFQNDEFKRSTSKRKSNVCDVDFLDTPISDDFFDFPNSPHKQMDEPKRNSNERSVSRSVVRNANYSDTSSTRSRKYSDHQKLIFSEPRNKSKVSPPDCPSPFDFSEGFVNDEFNAKQKGWSVDEPEFTEPPNASPSHFEFHSRRSHSKSSTYINSKVLDRMETKTVHSSSTRRSKMSRTRITKSSIARVGESPFMEQIVIQRMKY